MSIATYPDPELTNAQLRAAPVPTYGMPIEMQASLTGLVGGKAASMVRVMGRRTTMANTTPFQDACNFLVGGVDSYTPPAVGTTYYANSTSVNDVAGSNGVSKIRLVSLDAAGAQQVTEVTLNGTTAVSIGAGYTYFQWMESSALGGTTFTAAGNITISSVNGAATESTTHLLITAGGNRSLDAKYRVPTGYNAYLLGWDAFALNQDIDTRLRATVFADDRTSSPLIFHFQDTLYLTSGGGAADDLHYLKCPAGADIKVSCLPKLVATARLDTGFHVLLVAV